MTCPLDKLEYQQFCGIYDGTKETSNACTNQGNCTTLTSESITSSERAKLLAQLIITNWTSSKE